MTKPKFITITNFLDKTNDIILSSKLVLLLFFLIAGTFYSNAQEYVPFTPRLAGGSMEVRGDIIFVGNNILNRASETNPAQANTPYNGTANNNSLWMEYIDIDNDPSTFSSSSAELNLVDSSCSQIRYAGLYWAGTYPNERSTDGGAQFNGTPRIEEWNEIKFKIPGGTYVDLIADANPDPVGQEDDIIMNGYQPLNPTVFAKDAPVICYKNITDLVRSNTDPTGEYTAANVRATRGRRNGSSSAGWVMVIIYENPNESGKFISTFDGYAGLSGTVGNVDVNVNGFRTLPAPFTVNARIGVGALEGDRGINGDRFFIEANSSGNGFTNLSTSLNPSNNFFNSTITTNGAEVPTRIPYGTNTLGTDLDLFNLDNQFNNVLPNDETGATLRFTSSGDGYGPFLATFSVEIIEPNIVVEKRVNTPGGNDITGAGVNLGQVLDYVLSFQNVGNDDVDNFTIRDVLPGNVSPPDGRTDFIASDFVLPPGVTYIYDQVSKEVIFTIPNNLVEENDPAYSIRLRVQVAENCFDFIDACSDLIQNIAYSTYQGVENSAIITDDPSVADFNACGFTVSGTTNFLLDDLADCNFSRTVELCGSSATLNAGDGFDSYVWYRDTNNNGEIDTGDPEINDGDPDNDPSTIIVNGIGTYIVDKIIADPCKGFKEIITVEPYGSGTIPNPIIEYFNSVNADADPSNDIAGEIVQCSVDNDLLPKLFLCGIADTKLLQVNIVDAQSIVWEQLDEGSCSPSGDDCANKALTCNWNQVGTGNNYTVNSEGQYRLSVTYQNGCTSRFYFNVFQNTLDLQYNKEDIVCNSPGNITITNLGTGYGYQLVDAETNTTLIPFSANNGSSFDFNPGENGTYLVEVTQLDNMGVPIDNACIFSTPVIGVLDRNVTYNVTATDVTCTGLGSINIQVNNADPNYEYELRLDDGSNGGQGTIIDDETAQPDNNFTFTGLNAGNYIVIARTDDGCSNSEPVTINNNNNLTLGARVSQHITCREGNILMDSNGGRTPHTYAIWSYVDTAGTIVTSYPTPQDIPSSEFQTSQIFDIYDAGDYTFVVVDRNNCFSFSNTVSIEFQPAADFDGTTVVDVNCFGESSGRIQFNLVNNNGYQLTFTLFDSNNVAIATNTSGNFPNLPAGDYIVSINQAKGSASCDYEEEYTIATPTIGLSANAVLIQDYTCLQQGIIEAQNVLGGTAPFEYSIDGINFVPDTTPNANRFENLLDGTYTISVRDANGCVFETNPIVIDRPNPPAGLDIVQSQITCPAEVVEITVTATNGRAPFVYEIIAPSVITPTSTSGNSASFDQLAPDTYTLRVTDVDGCAYDENYTINPINPISISGTTLQPITCFGAADGSIQFNVIYQTGQNFTYTVTGPSGVVQSGGTQPIMNNLINLEAGEYTLDIVDTDTNCTYSETHRLEGPPSALTVSNITTTQPTCITDGSVNISASGGWGGYSYTVNNPDTTLFGTNTTGDFSGLVQSGIYNGTIIDANDCSEPFTFTLDPAIAPVLAITPNQDCYDDAVLLTLTATVTTGGDGNFEYSLNNGPFSSNNVFSGLSSGTYTIDVRDGKNCTDSQTITIDTELTVTASAGNIAACGTVTDVDVTAAGGDGIYVYAVVADGATPVAGDFAVTNPISVTGTGDYDVYVRENNGNAGFCEAMYDINIVQDAPVAAVPTVTDATCFGGSDGSISLAASGGEAPYTYSIDGGATFGPATTFNNLSAGSYDVRLRDANNCELTLAVTLNEPAQLMAEAVQTEPYTCLRLGEITVGSVTPTTGGSGDYQYSINGGTWTLITMGGTVFTDLLDGTYTVRVRDANNIGCIVSLPNIIIAPLPTEPTLSSSVAYNCDGTGNITVLPNDLSYTYSIDGTPAQPGNVFNDVAVGNHTITVDYGSDCTVDTLVNVQAGNAFEASIIAYEDLDCNGDNSGSITFEADNFGPGGFEYSLDNFATILGSTTVSPQTISSLSAGSYTISVRDVDDPIAGCTVILNQSIAEPTVVTVSNVATQPTCIEDGSVVITANGGTGGYSYDIELPDATTTGSQGSNLFTGLNQLGLHTITVTDVNGCTETDTFTLTAPPTPVASIDPISDLCYDSSNPGSATVVVGAAGGTAPYVYKMNTGAYRTSNTFANLIPGNYTFEIRDANGCKDVIPFIIEPQLTANVVLTKDIDCSVSPDAILDLQVNGGYAPFTYELEIDGGGYFAYTGTFPYTTGSPGIYRFRVTDSQGCIAESNEIMVTATVNPVATTTVMEPTCFGDTNGIVEINVDPNFGSSPYEISFDGSTYSNQRVYPGLGAGTYSYTVRDSKSCTYIDTVTLTAPIEFLADVVPVDVSCGGVGVGDILGRIDINITQGGASNFTYTLYDNQNNIVPVSGSNPIVNTAATSVTFDGLDFGDYYVRILDANGCEYYENPVRVLANPFLMLDTAVIADCLTGGTVEVTADSGSGNYTFSIYDAANTPPNSIAPGSGTEETATFTGLDAGQTYVFRVIDNNTGCSSYVEADIPSLSGINVVPDPIVSDAACFGDTNGSIAFQLEGFDASVTDINYEIRERVTNTPLGASYQGTVTQPSGGPTATPAQTVSNIPPGDYVLFFREATSPFCSNTFDFRILEPNPLTLTVVDQNNGNCNDDANVTVIASGGNGSYTYAFVEDGTTPVAGDYGTSNYAELNAAVNTAWDVYVLDGNGCSIPPLDIVILQDTTPVITGIVANECAANEGEFMIEITLADAGISPHNLSLNGGSFQSSTLTTAGSTHQFTNLSSGNYTIEVRDFNGCGNLISLEIFKPTSITTEVTTQPTCFGNDGEALITAYGGSGFYMYELFDAGVSVTGAPQSSPIFTGLDSGVYTAFVYDQVLAGCDAAVDIELEVPRAVVFTAAPTPVSCFDGNDGTITATLDPTMDNPPYTYQLFQRPAIGPLVAVTASPQTSSIFNNLTAANNYVVRAYSGRGCLEDVDVIVSEPALIANIVASVVEFGCSLGNNGDNASVTVNAGAITGGSGNYVRYEFVDNSGSTVVQSGGSNVLVVTDRTGGSYTINIYDDNGCSGSTTATVLPFDEMTGATAAITDTVTCTPGNDGEITITATSTVSDSGKYEYSIDNGANYQVSNVFGGLSPGTHNFLVRHVDTGCTVTASETLAEPNTFTIDVVKTGDVICFGTETGEVTFELIDAMYPGGFDWTVLATNGTPTNFGDDVFVVNGNEATNGPTPIVNLGAGEYYVSISQADDPFCTNIEYFNIAGPDAAITGATVVTDITCVPGDDGSITITNVAGGWGGYTYYVGVGAPSVPADFLANATFGGFLAGTYQAWALDAQGCEQLIQDNIVLADPTPISASLQVNQENCTNLQGEIEVTLPTGGQGSNHTYQLIMGGSNFRAPQNTRVFSGLGAGNYEVRITDQWGCTFTTPAESLYEQMGATTRVAKAIDCTVTPGGEITVNVTGGSSNLEFEMTAPGGSTVTQSNGVFTFLTEVGTYSFTVTDLETTNPVCERTVTQNLDAPVDPVFLDATIQNVSCFGGNDGSIQANIDPATNVNPIYQYELYDSANLTTPIAGPQNNALFTGLIAGGYQVKIISSRGCEGVKNETITEPTELLIDATATEFSCSPTNSVNTATVTVTILDGASTLGVASGTSPYLYSIDNVNYQLSNTFNITDDGTVQTITVYVTDGKGCPAIDTVTVQPLNTFTASVRQDVAITCTNDETITVSVTDNGLPHNYSFELLPIGNGNGTLGVTTATTATFDLSAVGSYTFRVTDLDTGCYVNTTAYRIAPFDFIRATATATTPVTCFGDSNGSLTINISGYNGTYNYEVFDTAGNSVIASTASDTGVNPRLIGNLTGGNYYVRITETAIPLCTEDTNTVTISSPDRPLSAVVTPVAEATCSDDRGEIRVTPQGGYKPYDIQMTNTTTGQNYSISDVQGMIFSNLSAGDFTIGITDNLGCFITYTETLVAATPIVANATPLITNLACYGDTGATVSANVTGGGSGTYEFQLNYYDATGATIIATTGIQSSANFNDLGAGIYSITVSDGWNCDITTNTVEVREPSLVEAILIRTDPLTCATGAEFELTATGGSGTYEYSADNVTFLPMTSNPLGLPETGLFQEGTYQYYVRDAINGCEAAVSNAITEDAILPLTLTVDTTASVLNCTGENTAIIYAYANGGLGNYQYELFTDSSLTLASRVAGPQTQGVFRNLAAGTYYVSVTSQDCTTTPEEVVIADPIPLSYTEDIVNITCTGENNGQITIALSGGAGGYQYAISPNLNQFDTINTFTGLAPGDYTLIAQDQNGCFEYLTYSLTEPTMLTVVATTTTPEICVDSQDGSITLEITGGTAPYSTALNSNDDADFVPNRRDFFDMAAGNYLIFVRDANGCSTNVVVDIEQGVNLNATVEPIYECSGAVPSNFVNITLEDDSVIGDVLYALDSVDPADFQLNPDFRNTAPGNHYITIAHANGCIQTIDFVIEAFEPLTLSLEQLNLNEITAIATGGSEEFTYFFDGINNGNDSRFYITRSDTYEVRVVDQNGCEAIANISMEFIDIELPNYFTPDGDGQNDFWIPRNMEQFPEILIKIFDRYGRVVSKQTVDSIGWDGKYSAKELPTGDYWYVVKLNGERDEREFVGHFTLYR